MIRVRAVLERSFVVTLLSLCVSPSLMAQTVGAIAGTVQDASGAVIPGATVILSNPGTIGGNQHTVTDDRGAYQFPRLVPSRTYSVRAELQGFKAALWENINVNADVTVRADLTLETSDVSETITVTAGTPLLDTTSVLNQTVLERATLDALPTNNDIWSIARMVPSVVVARYDVGGSESMQQYNNTVHGARFTENTYLLDGLDFTNPAGSPTGTYLDVAMFQEVNYSTGGAGAEYEKGGLLYSLVSKTGTNAFHGWLISSGTNKHFNSDNLTSALQRDLLAAVPARVLLANPNFTPRVRLETYYDVSVGANGPIIGNKLWFATSLELKEMNRFRVGQYNADGTQGLDDNLQRNYSFKFSWQPTARNQIHYIHTWNQRLQLHRVVDAVGADAAFYESRAMALQDVKVPIDLVKWTSTLSPRLLMDVVASRMYTNIPRSMQPEVKPGDIPAFDVVTQTHMVAQGVYGKRPEYPKHYINSSVSYFAGAHDLKAGYQYNRGWTQLDSISTSHYPSGLRAIYRNGVPDAVNTYNTPNVVRSYIQDHGFYVQDKWRATRKLILNLGLRIQKTNGWVPAVCQEETIFVAGRCFDEVRNVPNWLDLAPRFGLVYDVTGDGKTALKLVANRYNVAVGASYPGRVNPMRTTNDTRSWRDLNGDLIPQLEELGPSTGFNLGTTNRYNPDVRRPYVNEFTIEIERQIPGDIVLSASFIHRETRRDIGSRNLAVPMDSYTPLVVTERNSGRQVTVYNQNPALRGRFDVLFDNFSELDADYNGVDLVFNKRLSNRWMIMGGLSYGRNVGDIYGTQDLNNPNLTFRRGVIDADVPWSFKVSGVYELPYGFRASTNVQHFTGFPEQDTVNVGSNTVALTQVSQSLLIAPRATNRLPNVNVADVAVKRIFRFGSSLTAEPALSVFNVTNANTIQNRAATLGPIYHRATSIMQGRMMRFDLNVKF